MKVCSMCKVEKELSEFHKRRGTPDGIRSACKSCRNAKNRKWREENPDYFRQYYRENREAKIEYYRQYHRENREALNEYYRQYRVENKESRSKYFRVWRAENPKKAKAGDAVHNSVRAGRMKPAKECICEDCGKAAAHYHHESYMEEHRLDVIPLCHSCHMRRHRNL